MWSADEKFYGVKTDSFIIQYKKVNVANMNHAKATKFEVEAPIDTEVQTGTTSKTTVVIPHDHKIQYGHNILTAVMFSRETGEAFDNWQQHKKDVTQLRFLSDVVRIAVVSTPQSFGTGKLFKATEKKVKDLVKPIYIKMPITHQKFMGLEQAALKTVAMCTY